MEKENPLVNKFLKQISKIIDHKLEKLTTVESAIVDQVNLDGTVNLHIPPDSTVFTNIQNQSIYQDLQVGDCVKVLKQNNKASNMWIIGGHNLKRTENIEPFKGVDYIIEQGQNGIWTYRKWNSGIAECWGVSSGTTSITTSWYQANMYVSDNVLCEKYPDSLFISQPTIQATFQTPSMIGGSSSWLYSDSANTLPEGYNITNSTGAFRLCRPTQGESAIYNVFWHALGRWK